MIVKKQLAVLGLCLLPILTRAQMPSAASLQNTSTSTANVTSQIDGLLKSGAGEIMAGITGYDVGFGDLLEEFIEKQIVEAVADASVFSPAATAIMDAYIELKNGQVADEVDKLKNLTKDALSRQLKLRYQDYKLKYEKLYGKARNVAPVKNSVTGNALAADMRNLYGDYVYVVDGFYKKAGGKLLKAQDANDVEFNLISTAIELSNDQSMKAKLAIANTEYDPSQENPSGEVTTRSVYDRMMIKRQLAQEILQRKAALVRMRAYTDQPMKGLLQKQNQKTYNQSMNLPSKNL